MTRGWRIALGVAAVVIPGGLLIAALAKGGRTVLSRVDRLPDPTEAELARSLPTQAKAFAGAILRAARKWNVSPWVLAAVGMHESHFGSAPGYVPKGDPRGEGDGGNAVGFWQIDKRYHAKWLEAWDGRVETMADYAAQLLAERRRWFPSNVEAQVAAYNASAARVREALSKGLSPDTVTYKGRYVRLVSEQLSKLLSSARAA